MFTVTFACGCVRVRVPVHAIVPQKGGSMILLSDLPLKHNLCEFQVLNRKCKRTLKKYDTVRVGIYQRW